MNDKQNAELNMFRTTSTVMEANRGKVEAVPKVKAAANELRENISLIVDVDKERIDISVPSSTKEKRLASDDMVDRTLLFARVLNAYAFETEDVNISIATTLNKSQMLRMQDNQRRAKAKSIEQIAEKHLTALADYGLDASAFADFSKSIEVFEALIVKPRDTIYERKDNTRSLVELFADTKSLLFDKLDKMMSLYKKSDPAFYSAYFSARNIINTAYRKRAE